ncbi:MAG: hypothetical protein A6F72_06935 [Cycloclasticus sp. symbiont of Poecilosclerida sp. N]|nr:MAG: hypothetical protein A6F72_06935 [Cycloclasticus sp. symbiont of Poecilosclerida sp. N]
MTTFNAGVNKTRSINAETLALMSKEDRDNIVIIKIIPPTIGGEGFGRILIKDKAPVYKVTL